MVVYHDEEEQFPEEFAALLLDAVVIGENRVPYKSRILDVIT